MELEGFNLERIGFIGDGAGITWAPLILIEEKEREVGTEELVLVENLNGNRVLAVCRKGFGRSPGLRRDRYTPGRAYVRIGRRPSSSRDSFDFELSVIGEVASDGLRQNKLIIAPIGIPVTPFPFRPRRRGCEAPHLLHQGVRGGGGGQGGEGCGARAG